MESPKPGPRGPPHGRPDARRRALPDNHISRWTNYCLIVPTSGTVIGGGRHSGRDQWSAPRQRTALSAVIRWVMSPRSSALSASWSGWRVICGLAQAINFDPERWRRLLPDCALWPDALDDRPRGSKWPQVDRATVLQIGARADDPLGALKLGARSVHRQIQVLVDTPPNVVGSRLQTAIQVLRIEGASRLSLRCERVPGGPMEWGRPSSRRCCTSPAWRQVTTNL